jgi:hypothetical protein
MANITTTTSAMANTTITTSTTTTSNTTTITSCSTKSPDLRFFDPLCSPDEEMLQIESDLINKVQYLRNNNIV